MRRSMSWRTWWISSANWAASSECRAQAMCARSQRAMSGRLSGGGSAQRCAAWCPCVHGLVQPVLDDGPRPGRQGAARGVARVDRAEVDGQRLLVALAALPPADAGLPGQGDGQVIEGGGQVRQVPLELGHAAGAELVGGWSAAVGRA
jgi:hypothetical protein